MRIWFLVLLLVLAVSTDYCYGQSGQEVIHAYPSDSPQIDGILEADWFKAVPAQGLLQIRPNEGQPATQETRVYILYSREALYVGFCCLDTAPDSIAGPVQRRDNDDDSDIVYVGLDTFHDHRNAYYFGVTAAGVQVDGTFSNEDVNDDTWDGVWESAVARVDSGWTAEMRIPFQGIRHGGTREDGWGIDFVRVIHRNQEVAFWQRTTRDQGSKVSNFGDLLGLDEISSARHVQVLPHTLGRWDAPESSRWQSKNDLDNLGLDLKIVPSSSWTMDLTYQPDFAQVDVDEEVINLSDYPVFLEEKRPFFLEGRDLFETSPIQLLYTRRITDPDYGGRITGQWGDLRGSALYARNITEEGLKQDAFAARTLWNVGSRSAVGATVTYLGDEESHAATAGMDARLRWREENQLWLTFAGVDRPEERRQPLGARANLFLAKGHFRGNVGTTYYGQDYNINDLGWSEYSNMFSQYSWIGYRLYPDEGFLRTIEINLNGWHESMPDGRFQEQGGN